VQNKSKKLTCTRKKENFEKNVRTSKENKTEYLILRICSPDQYFYFDELMNWFTNFINCSEIIYQRSKEK